MPGAWAVAHTTQFTAPGWRLLKVGRGSGQLAHGGTYVGYAGGGAAGDRGNLTIVIEKMDRNESLCERGGGLTAVTEAENATFTLPPSLFGSGVAPELQLWVSHFGSSETVSSSSKLFQKQAPVAVVGGSVTILVQPNHVYTLSTVTTAGRGRTTPPPPGAFPAVYTDNFNDCRQSSIPKFVAPMSGAFECVPNGGGDSGASGGAAAAAGGDAGAAASGDAAAAAAPVMSVRQMAPAFPICDRGDVTPYAIIGDAFRTTYNITLSILLPDPPHDLARAASGGDGGAGSGSGGFVGARVKGAVGSHTGMDGIFLAINATAWWVGLKVADVSADAATNGSDATDAAAGRPSSVLAAGILPPGSNTELNGGGSGGGSGGGWRRVSLAVEGTNARGTVDGAVLFANMTVPAPRHHYTAKVAGYVVDLGEGGYAAFGTVGYSAGVEFDVLTVVSH